ncbi:MAG TPA: hypothetical protein VFV35_04405 [Acidimicrobiales bacterium]|nr:hypothetical protein [Acidimicrobiales bacterium]
MCDDRPDLAVPALTPAAPRATERQLAELAVAARQVVALDGRGPVRPDAPSPGAEVFTPSGSPRATLTGVREGRRRVELRLYADAVVVASGPDDPGQVVPLEKLVSLTVECTARGGRVRIGAGGGGSRTLRFSKSRHSCTDVAGHVQAVDPRRFAFVPASNRSLVVARIARGVLVLALLAVVAVAVRAAFFPPAEPGADLPEAARRALRDACPVWRAAPLAGDQLAVTATDLRPAFAAAAAEVSELSGLPADVDTIVSFAPKAGRPNAPLVEAAAFSAAVERVDGACARVGL